MFPAAATCCVRACLDWIIIFVWHELMRFQRQKMKAFVPKWFFSLVYSGYHSKQSRFSKPLGDAHGKTKQNLFLQEQRFLEDWYRLFHIGIIFVSRCFEVINIHNIITALMCFLHPSRLSLLLTAACVTNWLLPPANAHCVSAGLTVSKWFMF